MRTYAVRARRAARLLLIGLLIAAPPLEPGLASVAFGATATPLPLSLGFSPSALYPVSEGTPVYTVGDTIWAVSSYNNPVQISVTSARVGSATAAVVATTLLGREAVTALYTFTAKDPDGVWNITLSTPQGPVVIPLHFVNLAARPISLGPFAYSLSGGDLLISANADLGDSYDQEVCATGNGTSAGLGLGLPTAMGEAGNVTLTPGTPFGVAAAGVVTEPFSFWFELYHSYALDATNTNNLVSEDLMAAESQPVAFSTNGTATTTLAWDLPVHEGRYEMRAYFQNSTSLDVVQTGILILNDSSWVSLADACPPQAVQSSSISYPASLTGGDSNWPTTFYFMYQTFGVQAVASFPVMANLSSVKFTFPPWNEPSLNVNVSPSGGVIQTSQASGSLFVLSSRYPTQVAYTLDINGQNDLAQGNATIVKSYSTLTEQISLGFLTVRVISDRNLTTTLEVTGPSVGISSGPVGANQSATFLLPRGNYTVTGLQANKSQSAQTSVNDGLADSLTLVFTTATSSAGTSFETFEIILIAAGAVAAVANVALWVFRSRSLRARMADASKPANNAKVP